MYILAVRRQEDSRTEIRKDRLAAFEDTRLTALDIDLDTVRRRQPTTEDDFVQSHGRHAKIPLGGEAPRGVAFRCLKTGKSAVV